MLWNHSCRFEGNVCGPSGWCSGLVVLTTAFGLQLKVNRFPEYSTVYLVRFQSAVRLSWTDSSVLCVHLRLHPGITWSHTAGSPCNVPPLSHVDLDVELGASKSSSRAVAQCSSTETGHICEEDGGRSTVAAEFSVLTFARKEGTGEWDYPWDLTGGLYR